MKKFLICLFIVILAFVSVFIVLNVKSESKVANFELSEIVENETTENQILNDLIANENVENINIEDSKDKTENDEKINQNDTQKDETKDTKNVETISNVKQTEIKENTTQPAKEKVVNTQPQKEEPKVEQKDTTPVKQKEEPVVQQEPQKPKCTATSHGVGVGNSNKWFNSETEAVNYFNNLINSLSDKVKNDEITFEEYNKQCPYGYETWSCPYCGKWTLNCYYR